MLEKMGKSCPPLSKFLAMPQPALVVGEENLVVSFGPPPPTLEMLPPSLIMSNYFAEMFVSSAECFKTVVLKLGSTEPQGFGEAVAGVRLRSE